MPVTRRLLSIAPVAHHVSSIAPVALVAHQGGWDEILFVVGPILLIAGLLRLAKHRVTRPTGGGHPDAMKDDAHREQAGPPPAP
ncbi:MAG: hypothetical protein ACKOYG_03720 [Ilumatobacteraceae bacterium]